MKTSVGAIFNLLKGRVALNIYFWLAVTIIVLNGVGSQQQYAFGWYIFLTLINVSLIACLVYTNNLVLVPRFLTDKKIKRYAVFVILLTFFAALVYTGVQKVILHYFPAIEIIHISPVSTPVTPEWDVDMFTDDFPVFFISFLLLVFVFTALWYMHDYTRQKKYADDLAKRHTEAELAFLKSQLNPHFLFNTLNNVYGLALQKSDAAPVSILKLSSLMRYMLHDSNLSLVPFEKEKEAMQAYIDLELLRLGDMQDFNFSISADQNYQLPPLLWLPVLENVFKHGTRMISDNYFIDYRFDINNGLLTIFARNNFKPVAESSDSGTGLKNLKKRIELLYPGRYSLDILNDQQFFTISLKVKLT